MAQSMRLVVSKYLKLSIFPKIFDLYPTVAMALMPPPRSVQLLSWAVLAKEPNDSDDGAAFLIAG